jgi:hypothetical protein
MCKTYGHGALAVSTTGFIQLLVEEKESKIKEGMKMMGLRGSVFITAWFLTCRLTTHSSSLYLMSLFMLLLVLCTRLSRRVLAQICTLQTPPLRWCLSL